MRSIDPAHLVDYTVIVNAGKLDLDMKVPDHVPVGRERAYYCRPLAGQR